MNEPDKRRFPDRTERRHGPYYGWGLVNLDVPKRGWFRRLLDWRSDMTLTEAVIVVGAIAVALMFAAFAAAL